MSPSDVYFYCLIFIFGAVVGYHGDEFARDIQGSVLDLESPPPTNQTGLSLSEDTLDTDLTVNIDDLEDDALSENKTQIISTEGANDIDINGLPPSGISVIVQNESVIVTQNPVTVDMAKEVEPSIIDEIADVMSER